MQKKGLAEGCEDVQKQRRAVEGEVQENGSSKVYFALEAKVGPGVEPSWTGFEQRKHRS